MRNVVEIIDMSYEGAGVGKLGGKVVFVPKTLVGDVVEIEKVKETKSFVVGKVLRFEVKSGNRVEAKCPYFQTCGGCDFQHCSYDKEKELKKALVLKEFEKVGWKGGADFVSCGKRFSYRNKIKLDHVNGKLAFHGVKGGGYVAVEGCEIASEEIGFALKKVVKFLQVNSFVGLKSVYIKQVEKDVGICFLFDKNGKNGLKNAKNIEILQNFSVFYAFGDVLESDGTQVFCVCGKTKFHKNLGDFICEVDVSAFNQVNDEVANLLYNEVVNVVDGKRVVNAYSGQGLLTMMLAKKSKFVYGIEYQQSAHACAERLAEQMGDYKICNICGKVEEELGKILLKDCIDVVVLDPAREGCDRRVLDEILQSSIEEIVYVSCNFSTQVRDVSHLQEKFFVESIKIFDMFPCTMNVETMVVLRRKN